jgi:hypothetical protein
MKSDKFTINRVVSNILELLEGEIGAKGNIKGIIKGIRYDE